MQRDLNSDKVRLIHTYHYLLALKTDDDMPASKYKIERICEVCGTPFFAKMIDSKYCSPKCSKKAYSMKKAQEKKEQQQMEMAEKIPQSREYISIAEAVAMFGVSRDTIYRLIRSGQLPAVNLGTRLTRISRAQIESMFHVVAQPQEITVAPRSQKTYKFDSSDSYTIGEVSKKFGVSDSTVYKTIRRMSIPTCQKGKFVYVPKVEIEKVFK